jgi:hypothetical protein
MTLKRPDKASYPAVSALIRVIGFLALWVL